MHPNGWVTGKPLTRGSRLMSRFRLYSTLLNWWIRDGRPFEITLSDFLRANKTNITGNKRIEQLFTAKSYDCGSCRENPNLLPDGTLLPCTGYVDSEIQNHMPNLLSEPLSRA